MTTALATASAPGALRRRVIGIDIVLAVFDISTRIRAFVGIHAHPLIPGNATRTRPACRPAG